MGQKNHQPIYSEFKSNTEFDINQKNLVSNNTSAFMLQFNLDSSSSIFVGQLWVQFGSEVVAGQCDGLFLQPDLSAILQTPQFASLCL